MQTEEHAELLTANLNASILHWQHTAADMISQEKEYCSLAAVDSWLVEDSKGLQVLAS